MHLFSCFPNVFFFKGSFDDYKQSIIATLMSAHDDSSDEAPPQQEKKKK
jgi:hypothetical protein